MPNTAEEVSSIISVCMNVGVVKVFTGTLCTTNLYSVVCLFPSCNMYTVPVYVGC